MGTEEEVATPTAEVAGPGAIVDEGIAPAPLLDNTSEAEYVDVLNPLTVDFVGQFGVTRPTQASVTIGSESDGRRLSEEDASRRYGVPRLSNPDRTGRAQIVNRVRIPSGQTMRLMGNEAQVIVRQLVNEIMAREGKKLQLADKFARNLVEQRIIIHRGYIQDIMAQKPVTVSQQLQDAIKQNQEMTPMAEDARTEKPPEPEFPTLEVAAPPAAPAPEPDPAKEPSRHILVEPKPPVRRKKRTTKPKAE